MKEAEGETKKKKTKHKINGSSAEIDTHNNFTSYEKTKKSTIIQCASVYHTQSQRTNNNFPFLLERFVVPSRFVIQPEAVSCTRYIE